MPSALIRGLVVAVAVTAGHFVLATRSAAQAGPAGADQTVAVPDPARLPANGHYWLTQSEERVLPDDTHIRFDWDHEVRFVDGPDGLIVEMTPVRQQCSGTAAICAGFARLTAAHAGVRRFRVGFGGTVAAARDAATPARSADASDGARRMQVIIAALGDGTAGPVAGAEVENLMMFAGRRLPAVGVALTASDQVLTVLSRDSLQAVIRVEQRDAADPNDGSAIVSTTDYTINLATGLLTSSVARDMLMMPGAALPAPTLLRERRTQLVADITSP